MSMTELPPKPYIRLIFRGFVISRITDGSATAIMDALRDSPCHEPTVKILEINEDGSESRVDGIDPNKPFSIKVEGPKFPRIQVLKKDNGPFDRRSNGNDKNDFRWHIDLGQLHRQKVKVNSANVSPMVTVDSALFYTSDTAPLDVLVRRRDASGSPLPLERLGKVGNEFSANIYLKDKKSKVLLTNDGTPIDLNPKSTYIMTFDCHCDVDPEQSDFPFIYRAIGVEKQGAITPLPDAERVDLEIEPPLTGPTPGRTYCLGGNVS